MSRITLGTAQFGSDYGISNKLGKPNEKTIHSILDFSVKNGINTFDTAAGYGDSEEILGRFFSMEENNSIPNIMTKISRINSNNDSFDKIFMKIENSIKNSKKKLSNCNITNYLLHNPDDMYNEDIIKSLVKLKEKQIVKNIGVSTYTEQHVKKYLEIPELDVIELPFNIFDTKLMRNGLLKELAKEKKIIFARSIFLQGLFFMKFNNLPIHLKLAKKYLHELHEISNEYKINISKLALTFVRDIEEINSIILGVNNMEQIKINLENMNSERLDDEIKEIILEKFLELPDKIINPSKWKNN